MTRRLALILLWLALIDRGVPPLLERVERMHYEGTRTFRFENSDLFGIGPLVDYLRDHPQRQRRRVVFFGNSMIFGFGLNPSDAIPAQFQKLQPDSRVYNAAINGQEIGTGYLVALDIIDSIDVLYVQVVGVNANAMLPSLIPIDDADLRRFYLTPPNRVEKRLQSWLGGFWHLYALNYRLQAALFGTSARVFVYLHKTDLLRALRAATPPRSWPPMRGEITVRAPHRAGPVRALTVQQKIKNALAELARSHRKRIVLLEFEWENNNPRDEEVAAFNAAYAPFAETLIVHLPPEVTFDRQHPVPAAAARIAEALTRYEAGR